MDIIEKAINFSATVHQDQKRKATNIPYIAHPFAVGMLLQREGCGDEVVAAGILHDTIEDTVVTYEELKAHFGVKVANLVNAASEQDKRLPWEQRKQHTIDMLKSASLDEIYIITADKLHNLRSIRQDLITQGEKVWERFSRGKKEQYWYYSNIVKQLIKRKTECRLITDLEEEVNNVFRP